MSNAKYPSPPVAWFTIGVLALAYTFSFLDRQILVLLVEPMRRDLGLTDTGVSLLTGFSFAIFYAVMGIPLGRVADHWSRKKLILIGVGVWGAMTIGCGLARNYTQLFVARMGVGVGEAALTPAAYSMVPDLFPPEKQARAMSVFVMGSFMGGGLSLIIGGVVIGALAGIDAVTVPLFGELRTWQLVIVCVGLATLLVLLPLSRILDPVRVGRSHAAADQQSFADVLRYLWSARRSYLSIFIGIPLANLFIYGMHAWMPTFFMRVHGWPASRVGIVLGIIGLVAGVAGGLTGGWLADRWRKAGQVDATMRATGWAILLALPLPALVVAAPNVELALAGMIALGFAAAFIIPLVPTAIQTITPSHMRAQISAMFLLFVNLIGIGFGPTAIALVTDYVFKDDMAVGWSIAVVGAFAFGFSTLVVRFGLREFRSAAELAQASAA